MISSRLCRHRDLVLGMIAARLLFGASKLATVRLWHTTTLPEELAVEDANEDELYQAMDWLLDRQDRIEKKLAARHLTEGSMVLYDLSSSYYEGRCCPLAAFGHNRDGKRGRKIIVYGVLTDAQGRLVAVEGYKGNTGDPSTVSDQLQKLRGRFGLSRVVLVGDRGMLTHIRIEKLRSHPCVGWVSALRANQIQQLAEGGVIQMSLFDKQYLAEVRTPQYPGERLLVCYNPFLAEERARKREALLEATEKLLQQVVREVSRRRKTPMGKAQIGLKVGRLLHRYKMGKHYRLKIAEGSFSYTRRQDTLEREKQLEGIYVIRTREPAERMSSEDVVRTYKGLSDVERAFRSVKGLDIHVRPIRHWNPDRVRAHIFLCLLAYYVQWHMRKALRPLLFEDEHRESVRAERSPASPARPSASANRKKQLKISSDGFPVHSFETLLAMLGTQCRNHCRARAAKDDATFTNVTELTEHQRRAFELLELYPGA